MEEGRGNWLSWEVSWSVDPPSTSKQKSQMLEHQEKKKRYMSKRNINNNTEVFSSHGLDNGMYDGLIGGLDGGTG